MRAVRRASFAARRKARPTFAAVVGVFLGVRFSVIRLFPAIGAPVGIILHRPDVRQGKIDALEIGPTSVKAPDGIRSGHVMPALAHTRGDPPPRKLA